MFDRHGDELEPIYQEIDEIMHNDGHFHTLRAGDEAYFDDENMYEVGTAVGVNQDADEAVYEMGQDVAEDDPVYDMSHANEGMLSIEGVFRHACVLFFCEAC